MFVLSALCFTLSQSLRFSDAVSEFISLVQAGVLSGLHAVGALAAPKL